jgi:hypothetical protein
VTVENHFQIQDGVMRQSADTLEEYQFNKSVMGNANELFQEIKSSERLKGRDGTKGDFDNRPGHVVLANEGFEWHPDTKTLFHEGSGKKVVGDGETITVVLNSYSSYTKNNTGIWDAKTGEFTYRRDMPASTSTAAPEQEDGLPELGTGTFKISADGKVAAPNAQSLAEAKTLASQREMANRAEELIDSWKVWSEKGKGLDQTGADISKKSGTVLAPELTGQQLGIPENDPLLSTQHQVGEYHDETVNYESFDLEQSGGNLKVGASDSFEQYGVWKYGTELSASKTDTQVNITLRNDELVENVQWNIQDGTVRYNKEGRERDDY